MGKLKFFFWSFLTGGIIMISSAFNKPTVMNHFEEIKQGDFTSITRATSEISDKAGKELRKRGFLKTQPKNNIDSSFDETQVFDINGVDYVFIQGKYYPYNPENIYYVDGEKTYFSIGKRTEEIDREVTTRKVIKIKPTSEASISLNPIDAYKPSSIKNMMKTIDDVNNNMGARNKLLEDLAE